MREEGAVGGAVGDSRRDGAKPAAEGVVTGTQVAGAWSSGSARDDPFPSLALQPGASRSQSPAQRNLVKKTRSSTKK